MSIKKRAERDNAMTIQESTERDNAMLKELFKDMDERTAEARRTGDWSDVFVTGEKEYPNDPEALKEETDRLAGILASLKEDARKMKNG